MSDSAPHNFTIVDVEQRSDAWHSARAGRLTGSKAADMLATIKSGEAAARRNLRTQLVLERITGKVSVNELDSFAVRQGVEREPLAYAAYQQMTGQELVTTGFLSHNEFMAGCSLDGHVGDFDGIIEIKCPLPATHLDYLKSGKIPAHYQKQVLHNLWISGAAWCDWFSFNPDFPERLQVKMVRVERDDWAVGEYEEQALQFLAEVDMECRLVERMVA